jgi:Domain of unknown function (DUF2383)
MTNLKHRGSTQSFDETIGLKVAVDDALEGYDKMLEKAEPSFRPTVSELIALHRAASQDLDVQLRDHGAAVDEDGSFMGTVHKTVVTLRSVVDDPDRDWIPGILDGEKRNLKKYDAAIAESLGDSTLEGMLRRHREALQRWVEALAARDARRGATPG